MGKSTKAEKPPEPPPVTAPVTKESADVQQASEQGRRAIRKKKGRSGSMLIDSVKSGSDLLGG